MSFGSKMVDGGNLILSEKEKKLLINDFPFANNVIRKLIGADEYINGYTRW